MKKTRKRKRRNPAFRGALPTLRPCTCAICRMWVDVLRAAVLDLGKTDRVGRPA